MLTEAHTLFHSLSSYNVPGAFLGAREQRWNQHEQFSRGYSSQGIAVSELTEAWWEVSQGHR